MTSVNLQAEYPWGKRQFIVYVTDWPEEYQYKDRGIDDQVERLKVGYNGTLPQATVEGFRKYQKIAREDKIPFAAFILYFYNYRTENMEAKEQYARARAFSDQKRWSEAAQVIEATLRLDPQSLDALTLADHIYHDGLFDYKRAFDLNAKRVQLGDGGYDFVEKHLTTSRFDSCATRSEMAWDEATRKGIVIAMSSLEFACLTAEHKTDEALAVGRRLRKEVAGLKSVTWRFTGTEHFISNSPAFADKAPQWVMLFEALEDTTKRKRSQRSMR
jgi:tetratricopeptide (TPR) repeat protein